MALAKYRLKGHESFILREGWITKALFAIDRDPLLFTVSAGADERIWQRQFVTGCVLLD